MEILALAAFAGATALAGWIADRRRARTRNETTRCAACGDDLGGAATSDLFLIHGRLVCPGCAEGAKRKTVWQFVVLVGAIAFATGMIAAEQGVAALISVPVGTTLLMTVGTVQLMKLANRRAQRRIAEGADPVFAAIEASAAGALLETPTAD